MNDLPFVLTELTPVALPVQSNHTANTFEYQENLHTDPRQDDYIEQCQIQEGNFNSDDSVADSNYSPDTSLSTDSENKNGNENNVADSDTEITEDNEVVDRNARIEITDTVTEIHNSRKKLRKPSKWKRNIKKLRVNSGLPYITEGNKEKRGKTLKPECGEKCRTKCSQKFSNADRYDIHLSFWNLKDNALQRQFVASHLEKLVTKHRRTVEGSNRGMNLVYFLTVHGVKVKVCKKFFMNTLDIGDKFIRTTWRKSDGKGSVENDKRGNFMKRETVTGPVKNKIREHITSFQRVESHYLRA
ncbi:uncharacterized protein [Diabrotica undecimpunctata]|uniref:uncharacterized protein n=1 Tax=Diabrotica undecimpunctata TaxID=50387 RepID=UPI003B631C1C